MKDAKNNILSTENQFENIRLIIESHKRRAYRAANYEQIATYWEVGAYISAKLKTTQWGSKIVSGLADYLKAKQPDLKGFDKRALYRMVQFFDTYSDINFAEIAQKQQFILPYKIVGNENPQFESVENQEILIAGNENPQLMPKEELQKIIQNTNLNF